MTAARLSPLQRQVLEQLAHIRVAPEDAWMTAERIKTLTGADRRTLNSLTFHGYIDWDYSLYAFRITDKGREALG